MSLQRINKMRTMTYRKVLAAALELGEKDRSKLVEKLQSSLPPPDDAPLLSDEWLTEIDRRTQEYELEKAEVLTWKEFKQRARGLRKKHADK